MSLRERLALLAAVAIAIGLLALAAHEWRKYPIGMGDSGVREAD